MLVVVDCVISEWSNWGDCSVTCGDGVQKMRRACLDGEGVVTDDAHCKELDPLFEANKTIACSFPYSCDGEIKFRGFAIFCHFRENKIREIVRDSSLAKLNPREIFEIAFSAEKPVKDLHLLQK